MPPLFRPLTEADIPAALQLCRAARWNQIERDWRHFLAISPEGCRAALDESGAVIGTVTTVRYAPGIAWIGMVLVNPACRGQGWGTRLLHEALELLSDVPSVWLDATPLGYPIYQKLGFEEDIHLKRMQRPPSPAPATHTAPAVPQFAADRAVFCADRSFHLEWLAAGMPDCARSAGPGSYAYARPGYHFQQAGPIVAPNAALAEQLLLPCLDTVQPVIVDATLHDPAWLARLTALGFEEQRGFIRMCKGNRQSKPPHPNEYAIMGPEFG